METTADAYEVTVVEKAGESSSLSLRKKPTKSVNFDDGVVIEVPTNEKPRHLQFSCKSTADGEAESCDVRLAKRVNPEVLTWPGAQPDSNNRRLDATSWDRRILLEGESMPGFQCKSTLFDENERASKRLESPVLFRLGYRDQVRMNQLIYSRINYDADTWYKVDVLLDWDDRTAAFFLNG